MAHNPIVKHEKLGRLQGLKVEKDEVAVLYQNQRFARELVPGERASNGEVYVVDAAARPYTWRAELPASDTGDFFAFTIAMRYAVASAARMVEDHVADTEALLIETLQPLLSRETRRFRLNQPKDAEDAVEALLTGVSPVELCGLRFTAPPVVTPNISEKMQTRAGQISRAEGLFRQPQSAQHETALPSGEHAYSFQARANVRYRVTQPDELPEKTESGMKAAERELWEIIEPVLRREGRRYQVVSIADAEGAMQTAIDNYLIDRGIAEFGLKTLAVTVKLDLDAKGRERYVELAEIEHEQAKDAARRKGVQANLDYYLKLAQEQGSLAPLWIAVGKGEVSLTDISQAMQAEDQRKLETLFELMDKFRSAGGNDEERNWDAYRTLVRDVTNRVVKSPVIAGPSAGRLAAPADAAAELPPPGDV